MRFGGQIFKKWNTPEEWAQAALEMGYSAVYFPVDYTADLKVIDGYKPAAKDADLVISEIGFWNNLMEKDPEKRFRSASQMLRHIAQLKANPTYVFRSARPSGANQQHSSAPQKYRSNYASGNKKRRPKPMPSRNNKSSRSMFPIISGVTTAFLIVIVATAITVFGNLMSDFASSSPKSITIPDYVNELYTPEFRQDLNSLQYYNITIVDKFTDEYPENTIIDQEPEAGENRKVAAGKQYCDLVLTVSRGEKEIILPDFTITEYRLAETQLRNKYALIPTTESEYNDFVPL